MRLEFLRRSHSARYRSYPSLNGPLTRELKINSPRGFAAGGIGARGVRRGFTSVDARTDGPRRGEPGGDLPGFEGEAGGEESRRGGGESEFESVVDDDVDEIKRVGGGKAGRGDDERGKAVQARNRDFVRVLR